MKNHPFRRFWNYTGCHRHVGIICITANGDHSINQNCLLYKHHTAHRRRFFVLLQLFIILSALLFCPRLKWYNNIIACIVITYTLATRWRVSQKKKIGVDRIILGDLPHPYCYTVLQNGLFSFYRYHIPTRTYLKCYLRHTDIL